VRSWTVGSLGVFVVGSGWLGFRGDGCLFVALEGSLDAPGVGGSDALVDRECLLEDRGGLGGVTIPQVALGESFQGASHSPDSSQNVT